MKKHKAKLRRKLIEQRQSLSPSQWQHKSQRICQNLQNNPLFIEAKTVLAYFSFRQEPDLSLLFKEKQYGFPRCLHNSLSWHFWQPPQLLATNQYNIAEPLATSPLVQSQQVDLILVPAVACDRNGYRLGYGGGYYDRLLNAPQWQQISTIGIVFDFAYVEGLPIESWDCKLNYICTESAFETIN